MKKILFSISALAFSVSADAMQQVNTSPTYWSIDGDPWLAQQNPNNKFGYQKIDLNYPEKDNSPGGIQQKVGLLSNSWFKVPTRKEDPRLVGKYDFLPWTTTSGYGSSAQSEPEKRAVAIFGTLSNAVIQEYDDWKKLKELNRNRSEIYNAIVNFQKSDKDQTVIFQDKDVDQNAYYLAKYNKEPSSLNFFHFSDKKNQVIYTGDSSDIIVHEGGHKRLTDMHPNFDSDALEFGGFHEGYGDTYSMIYSIRSNEQRSLALKQCGYNLHNRDNVISDLAEQFGEALGQNDGLRNLDTNKIWGETELEVHEIGQIVAGGWYDVLADGYRYLIGTRHQDNMSMQNKDLLCNQALKDAGDYVARLSLLSTLLVNNPKPGLGDFVSKALSLVQQGIPLTGIKDVDNGPWDVAIKGHFGLVRKIPVQSKGSINANIVKTKNVKSVCGGLNCQHK